ncbi:MAG: septation protein A [Buchnera aphidicola (Kaburagia rhusicola ensigallis)]
MKHLLNITPILAFFIAYKFYNIFYASIVLIITTVLSCILMQIMFNKVERIDYINCISVLFFGSLTLLFHNSAYIKWKVTIVYLILSLVLFINQICFKKLLIQKWLGKKIKLTNSTWNKLNIIWSVFFLSCAGINVYVIHYLSENAWVFFKVFGLTSITLCFMLLNGIYISLLLSKKNK